MTARSVQLNDGIDAFLRQHRFRRTNAEKLVVSCEVSLHPWLVVAGLRSGGVKHAIFSRLGSLHSAAPSCSSRMYVKPTVITSSLAVAIARHAAADVRLP